MNSERPGSWTGLVQQPVQIVASLRSHDLTLFVRRHSFPLVAQQIRLAVVRAKQVLRDVFPPVAGLHVGSPRRIERIEDATARLRAFATDQEKHLALAVV